jgi:hypothetical protein
MVSNLPSARWRLTQFSSAAAVLSPGRPSSASRGSSNELNIETTLPPPYLDHPRQPSTDAAYLKQIALCSYPDNSSELLNSSAAVG